MPHPEDGAAVVDKGAAVEHQTMVVLRLASARDVIEALLTGQWCPVPELLEAVVGLVRAAASDARSAEALAA